MTEGDGPRCAYMDRRCTAACEAWMTAPMDGYICAVMHSKYMIGCHLEEIAHALSTIAEKMR